MATINVANSISHLETAPEYKQHTEELIAKLQAESAALVGKEHHKERSQKGKAIAGLRAEPRYIDACRVLKGLQPTHGFFAAYHASNAPGSATPKLSADEAAKIAAEAEAALKELEPPHEDRPALPEIGTADGKPEDIERLMRGWFKRVSKLETTMAEPLEVPPEGTDDISELENIATEVMAYRQQLKTKCGYRNKDLKEYRDLQRVEDRLDTIAGALLPDELAQEVKAEGEELRHWEQRLMRKLVALQHNKSISGLKPSAAREVERLLSEIADLKVQLRGDGLTEHEQDKDERVLMRLIRLAELRQWSHHDKKQEKREKEEFSAIRQEVEQIHGKIEAHKRRLRDERGFTKEQIKYDPEVYELEERLSVLQKMSSGM